MDSETLIGRTIGPYEILEKIGQGGMAEVYKGHHTALRRMVAIKLLGRTLQSDEDLNRRFQREAQAIAALRHPNIVQVYDFGTFEGGHYLVMEFVKGHDLREEIDRRLKENRPFTPQEILSILGQVASALDYAHEQGIIHRDVKPGNIMLTPNGQAILGDFGLAMLSNRLSQATLGRTFGTPEYIAPEQAMDSRSTVPQSDIYALGGILYEMVTGRLPFEADSAISLALKHINEKPTPPRKYNPSLPKAVEEVILKALAKDPQERYATGAKMMADLQRAWGIEPSATPLFVTPPPDTKIRQERPRRNFWWLLLLGLLLLAGGSIFGYVKLHRPTQTQLPLIAQHLETATQAPSTIPTRMLTPPTQGLARATAAVGTSDEMTRVPPIPPATSTPTPSPSPTATKTPTPTPTATSTPTASPPPSPTPTLAPGAVMTRSVDGMMMRFVPEGNFLMGAPDDDPEASQDEKPQHQVILSPFWMDEHEVTVAQYKQCVAAEACAAPFTKTDYDNPAMANHPMAYISWEQAAAYCQWIAAQTGRDASLPTEAQWEKAASWDPVTQSKRRYPWGDELDKSRLQLGSHTAAVGSYPSGASAYGILDMAGNVWEWTSDWYDKRYYRQETFPPDPQGPDGGQYKVFRGGAYDSIANFTRQLRTTYREVGAPESTADRPAKGPNLGFRCVINGK